MEKPTIFFSHSSKDRDSLLILKNLIEERTVGTLKIFMSSDGQSIPFGSNWIHKIEDGLKNAKIMFVFITPNSLMSSWIYFEAGFAYSKEIQVIPIGIGVDIGQLSPPLNLLQGFNISSADSLNNIINIINKKFDCTYKENFKEEEYNLFNLSNKGFTLQSFINDKVESISSSIFSYIDENNEKITLDIMNVFDKINNYFIESDYKMSIDNKDKRILTNGLQLEYTRKYDGQLLVNISPYDLDKSYKILNDIIEIAYNKKDYHYIDIGLTPWFWTKPNKFFDFLRIRPLFQCQLDSLQNEGYKIHLVT